jgi:glycosyltransferase involved in cell wall biosynthesis
MEILVVDGKSDDQTLSIVKEFQKRFNFINIIINEKKIVPIALNLGIKSAKGDYIIRLDAHSKYPKDYFSKLIYWSEKLNADNVGAVAITDVLNKNSESSSIKKVMSDKLGVGNSLFRIGVEGPLEVDTVPFGCYKKEVFEKFGLFDERLERNQDIEFNKRIKRGGAKIYLIPNVEFVYFCRDNYSDIAKNRFNTGRWIIRTSYYTNTFENLNIRHFVPVVFVVSLLLPLILSLVLVELSLISLLSFLSYIFLIVFRSNKIINDETTIYNLILAFFILHFSYGIGSLQGIFDVIKLKIKSLKW